MAYLLDTVTLSELRKKSKGDRSVVEWQGAEGGAVAFVSVITMNEIRYGAKKVASRDPVFGSRLDLWYREILAAASLYSILLVNLAIAEEAADLRVAYRLSYNDSFIAATASVHGLTLATRNTVDFVETGVRLLNPWEFST